MKDRQMNHHPKYSVQDYLLTVNENKRKRIRYIVSMAFVFLWILYSFRRLSTDSISTALQRIWFPSCIRKCSLLSKNEKRVSWWFQAKACAERHLICGMCGLKMPAKSIILWQNKVNKSIRILVLNGEMLCLFFVFFRSFGIWHVVLVNLFYWYRTDHAIRNFLVIFSAKTELMIKTETKNCDTVCMSSR